MTMFDKIRSAFKKTADAIVSSISEKELGEKEIEEVLNDLMNELLEYDVAFESAEQVINAIRSGLIKVRAPRFGDKTAVVNSAIYEAMLDLLRDIPDMDLIQDMQTKGKRPYIMMYLGPNGYGKTTTIAKVTKYLMDRRFSVVWAAADTFRAGAIEQLEGHSEKLGVKVIKHQYGADPAAVVYDAVQHAQSKRIDVVMIDTAGRMHTDKNLMEEIRKIHKVATPDLSVFVADAMMGNEALEIARTYVKYVPINALIMTKVDAYPKGGSVLTLLMELKRPILFMGTGQGYDDLQKFDKSSFIKQLLGMEGMQ
ncbi:signal recognition particle-docking protein FtsY [Thermocladium modestius]|uniref:Signal recognition particle-docking protein FtsY n=2 Tax=Thermocladium modestius TaxID=62609 RepID=A0A830GZ01_9CREN|nr:signal recognition particle-docking protein FtsY [Thermocladium modestius]